mgnify:CR=1 FL=1
MTKPGANDLFGSLKAYATRVLGDEINPEKSAAVGEKILQNFLDIK